MNKEEQVVQKPIVKLNWYRKIMRFMPYHCSYCGKLYRRCHSNKINMLMPNPQNGKCCPDGHEGYVVEFTGYCEIIHWFDFVKNKNEYIY
jgi:hypothetical protein